MTFLFRWGIPPWFRARRTGQASLAVPIPVYSQSVEAADPSSEVGEVQPAGGQVSRLEMATEVPARTAGGASS